MDAVARLRSLPESFTFAGFCRLTSFSANAAAACLRRWKTKQLIETAGDRAGIYFNKLKCPVVDSSHRIDALLYQYPTAILCGESVLHATGWITQIPARLSVAVMSRPSFVSFYGFEIHARPLSWFKKVHRILTAMGNAKIYGMRALPPSLALVDLYADPKAWHPDIDDLDIPTEQFDAALSAGNVLNVELPRFLGAKECPGRIRVVDITS